MDSPIPAQPIVREVVLDVQLPRINPTERVEVRRIRMLPGYPAGLHVHNGPVIGSIVEESVIYQVEGEPQSVLHPGDVFYEPESTRIARFDPGLTLPRFSPISCYGPTKSQRSSSQPATESMTLVS